MLTVTGSVWDFFKKQEGDVRGRIAGEGRGKSSQVDWGSPEEAAGSPGGKWVDSSCVLEGQGAETGELAVGL